MCKLFSSSLLWSCSLLLALLLGKVCWRGELGRAWKRGRMVENFRTEKPWKVRPVDVLGWFWNVKPKGEVKILAQSQGSWPPSLIRSRLQPHLDRDKTRTRSKLGRNANHALPHDILKMSNSETFWYLTKPKDIIWNSSKKMKQRSQKTDLSKFLVVLLGLLQETWAMKKVCVVQLQPGGTWYQVVP